MSDKKVENEVPPLQSPRRGAIELLQVFSLLLLPVAYLLPGGWYRAVAIGAAVLLGAIPFFLVQPPEREPSVIWYRGFKITSERLRTLEEVGIPHDILQAMEAMIGVYYPKSRDLRNALFLAVGEARVQPWLNVILTHAKYYGKRPAPPPQEAGAKPQPGDPQGIEPKPA
jgi:hypothetical protein